MPRGWSPSPAAGSRHRRRRPRRRRRAGSRRPRVRRPRPDGCRHVHGEIAERVPDGHGHARLRRQVVDDDRPPCAEQRFEIGDRDVEPFEPDVRRQDSRIARGQVVDDQDVHALRDQAVHQVAADEARSSGDDRPRRGSGSHVPAAHAPPPRIDIDGGGATSRMAASQLRSRAVRRRRSTRRHLRSGARPPREGFFRRAWMIDHGVVTVKRSDRARDLRFVAVSVGPRQRPARSTGALSHHCNQTL